MNLGQARTELLARGYDNLSVSRANTFLNDAQHEFNEFQNTIWPWLETTTTGVAPLTTADLRDVLFVVNTIQKTQLRSIDVRQIVMADPSLGTIGNPLYYWLDNLTLRVYPLNTTDTLSVRYVKAAPDLSADSDTPLFPVRYHSIWVDIAEVYSLEDVDDYSGANTKRQSFEAKLARIANGLVYRTYDGPQLMTAVGGDY